MRSMTAYGAGRARTTAAEITVELRSVNQRFLDVKLSAPREYLAWEIEIRDRIRERAERGRVEVSVIRRAVPAQRRYHVALRADLARAYVAAARTLARQLRLPGKVALTDVLHLPDLFEVTEQGPNLGRERRAVRQALATALGAFDRERRREGRNLQRDMQRRAAHLRRLTQRIQGRLPVVLAGLRRQVEERLVRLAGDSELDLNRVAQEVATLADRSDVTEELVRLASHLGAVGVALRQARPVGKRVEFLLQEVHRELNTTGAKAGDLTINDLVLTAKGEVEKLREQVQNVE